MLHAILVIARARFLIVRNTFWRGRIGRKIGIMALLAALAAGAFGLYWLMSSGVQFLTSATFAEALAEARRTQPDLDVPSDIRPFLTTLPSIMLFGALLLIVLTSFSNLLASLYLSGDMDMLLVAPVPMRAVFIVKFFSGLLVPYLLLFMLLGPALVGFGRGLGFGVGYYAMLLVVLALFPLLPAALGALLVMAVVRVIPARRAREIVGVLGGLIGIFWYLFSQFGSEIAPRVATINTLDNLRRLNLPILPSAWAARALLAAGQGEWLTLLVFGGLFVGLSVSVFAGCVVLAERLYYAGWANMAVQGGKVGRRTKDEGRRPAGESLIYRLSSAVLPAQSAAILYKDLRVFPRDLKNLQQVLFPLVLAGVWSFQLLRMGGSAGSSEIVNVLGQFGSAGISFFICLSLSSALAGTGISREGRGYWLLQTAPVSAWQVLLGKLVLAYLPFPTIGTLFVAVLSVLQGTTLSAFLSSLGLLLLVGLGASCITLGMGAAFPKFNWENPNQQSTLQAGCLAPVLYMLYIALAAGVVIGLPAFGGLLPQWSWLLAIVGWLFGVGITALVVWAALSFGAARLERVEVT